jgi:hypothetical protein
MQLLDAVAVFSAFAGGSGIACGVLINSVPVIVCGSVFSAAAVAIIIYSCCVKKTEPPSYDQIPSFIY